MKKRIIMSISYAFIAFLAAKLSEAYRLAPGAELAEKVFHISDGLELAFQTMLPSLYIADISFGIAAAVAVRIAVYMRGKNAKKFRRNV